MSTTGNRWDKKYERDIHNYLCSREKERYLFRGQSHLLHLRRSLVEWMTSICEKMEFCSPVQHLAVYFLDIFMDNHNIHSEHIQFVALGCLIVAVKLEENEAIRPKNSDFNAIIGNKYSLSEFILMEINILTFFEWDISYPTAAHFAEYYAIYALSPSDLRNDGLLPSFEYVQQYVKKYIDYFLDVIILDYAFHKFNPSL
ncbi:Cyclin-J, partial [Stegodyphus mimosarum]